MGPSLKRNDSVREPVWLVLVLVEQGGIEPPFRLRPLGLLPVYPMLPQVLVWEWLVVSWYLRDTFTEGKSMNDHSLQVYLS